MRMDKKNHFSADLSDKWGEKPLAMGWTAIPTSLLFLQKELEITAITFNILMNLVAHWWISNEWPHPSQERIASRMNVSPRTVQRGLQELEAKGLIKRIKTSRDHPKYRGRNRYDLSGLINLLEIMTPNLKQAIERTT